MATKDRQEIELSAQRVTLEEQRTHIDILDTALTNAQANVVRLEEEVSEKSRSFLSVDHFVPIRPVILSHVVQLCSNVFYSLISPKKYLRKAPSYF